MQYYLMACSTFHYDYIFQLEANIYPIVFKCFLFTLHKKSPYYHVNMCHVNCLCLVFADYLHLMYGPDSHCIVCH